MDHNRSIFTTLVCVLLGFGTLMVYSASITSWPTEFEQVYLSRHLLFVAIAIATGVACAFVPMEFWFRAAPYLYWGTILLLVAVLIPGIGTRVNGSNAGCGSDHCRCNLRNWLRSLCLCSFARLLPAGETSFHIGGAERCR